MLHAAAAAATEVRARRRATHGTGLQDALGARFDNFTMGAQHPRFNFLTGQTASDKPGLAFMEGDTTAVVGQSLNSQLLLFAGRHLGGTGAASRLEAQASLMLGHQLGAS
jgi:hypothetical protein